MINQYEKKNKLKFYVNTNKKSGEKIQRYHMLKNQEMKSYLYATLCDVATQCDAQNESISKKRPLRDFCVLASHSVA